MRNRRIFGLFSEYNGQLYTRHLYVVEDKTIFDMSFEHLDEHPFEKWFIKKGSAICDFTDESNILKEFFDKSPDYKNQLLYIGDYSLVPLPIISGNYHPRIYRPQYKLDYRDFNIGADAKVKRLENRVFQVNDYLPSDLKVVADGVSQLSLIMARLKDVCKTVEPNVDNFSSYGHELRNLLILACTEVEAQLRGIYKANSASNAEYLQMKDYHKLNKFLRLDEFVISFGLYPWLPPFRPFKNWINTGKDSIMDWYTAYNLVKHDREDQFANASLLNVLNAVCATAILINAQYGQNPFSWRELVGGFFEIKSQPEWGLYELYLPPMKDEEWIEVKALSNCSST